jgi:hypothetical protein
LTTPIDIVTIFKTLLSHVEKAGLQDHQVVGVTAFNFEATDGFHI